MEVIDITSSPEPMSPIAKRTRSSSRQPGPSSRKRPRPVPKASLIKEVIELTDSEDELPVPRKCASPKKKQPTKKAVVASDQSGPSNAPVPKPVALFGAPRPEVLADVPPAPGSSSQHHSPRRPGKGGAPLFYPSSDEEREQVAAPPPRQAGTPPHAPPPVILDLPSDDIPLLDPPPPPRPEIPAPVIDPADEYVVRVIEIVPDVQPAHVLTLVEQFMDTQPGNVVEFVLHALFENSDYPKVDKKGKRKKDEDEEEGATRGSPKTRIDYGSKDREYNCGPHYFEISLEQLMMDFPRIPKPHIRSRLLDNRFYAPTYILLSDELKQTPQPFRLKSTNSVVSGKGKAKHDPEFDKEREWVLLKAQEIAVGKDASLAEELGEQEYEDNGEGIECGCCFSSYPFDKMVQCPEAHLFCTSCMTSYASNLLGTHNPSIACMDQSGCTLPFPESELARFLPPKLFELYQRVKQRKEIEDAGLENLEECPFCEYRCVIENEMEKLFRCENEACGAVTCRGCKKPDHLPRSCKEVEEDKHLDAQHVIEEAMTRALMRNCPKCQKCNVPFDFSTRIVSLSQHYALKAFIKEMGCNKMTCPNCRTVSCYICRKVINGYDHFGNPPPYTGRVDKNKCSLWDAVEQRHAEEVSEAAKRALEELKRERPDVDEKSIKVDIPPPPPPAPAPGQPGHHHHGLMQRVGHQHVAIRDYMGMGMGAAMAGGAHPQPFVFGQGQEHGFPFNAEHHALPPPPAYAFGHGFQHAQDPYAQAEALRAREIVAREHRERLERERLILREQAERNHARLRLRMDQLEGMARGMAIPAPQPAAVPMPMYPPPAPPRPRAVPVMPQVRRRGRR
ncbi:hypothetical protein HYDPIDRAFT_139939 [Hydnomerulius pinastri MD-312]|uniref:RING-type domain-containing protein n=1 Tax=Hydnomerulius pinastri MD-312 TaxID=994086 RepID=A0A0C9W1Z1_9AGAM|nr:hypothetical protein HYDPIDRAFT_139939 [Hydnomerulius pinastri MD-312]